MKTAVILMVLYFASISAINPGFKARVTQSGLNYANSVAMSALSKAVRSLKIPDQTGKSGKVSFTISGMSIRSFTTPSSSMKLQASSGIRWSAAGAGLALHGNFRYQYKKGWFKISDHGSFDASLNGVSFALTVQMSDASGKPHLSGVGCTCGISGVKVRFHGGASWIYNIFSKYIGGKIKDMLRGKMCGLVVQAVNTDANRQLQKLPMTVLVAKKFKLDYSLNANPLFKTTFMDTMLKGEVYWNGDQKECPFKPDPLPASSATSKMLYLWVSEYMGNSLAYSGYTHGFLQYNLTAKDLPPGNRSLLNTTCSGVKCIGSLIPQIGQKYPNSVVMFRMHASAVPQIRITKGIVSMNFSGNVDLYAQTPKGKTPFLFTITCNFLANVTATIQGQLLKGKITSTKQTVNVKNSTVGTIPTFVIQLMMNAAVDGFVIPTLNAQGQKGLVLPVTDNIKFKNAQLYFLQGAVLIATDLSYLSDAQLAAMKATGNNELIKSSYPHRQTEHNLDPRMSFKVVGQKNNLFEQI